MAQQYPQSILFDDGLYKVIEEYRSRVSRVSENIVASTGNTITGNQNYTLQLLAQTGDLIIPFWAAMKSYMDSRSEKSYEALEATTETLEATQHYWLGLLMYLNEFMNPYWTALESFLGLEKEKLIQSRFDETASDYLDLYLFNLQIAEKGMTSTLKGMSDFNVITAEKVCKAAVNSLMGREGEDIRHISSGIADCLCKIVHEYPDAIREIEKDYGFHFDDGGYVKVDETDRFILYQVLPRGKNVTVRKDGKPVIIMHPYVLGPNILAFLPGEKKSYVHAYADQSIPTYIRVLKDIQVTPAVQLMTGEDDALDTKRFCEKLKGIHGRQVTLNGFCQGGFVAVLDILSGKLDGMVDALITCVAPMDGTRSVSLVEYLRHLPSRFRDLGYALKTLPNGNRIVDGKVMSWVYKLKSMDKEAPLVTFYRDMTNIGGQPGREFKISNTAAALNHWLIYDRSDLPEGITKLSFDSYTIPISKDGTLPVRLFGKPLNFRRMKDKGIKWLLCYAAGDDLVDRDAALAPLDFIEAEVTVFPKGHGSIATSWSNPSSECALHTRFGNNYRGPVRFQLDLDENP